MRVRQPKFSDRRWRKAITCLSPNFRAVSRIVVVAFAAVFLLGMLGCGPTWTGSVGAVLAKDNRSGRVFVREVAPGQAAAEAGLADGDEIVRIAGQPVEGMTPGEVRKKLRGEVGSILVLTVVHDGVTHDVKVERTPFAEP